MSFIAKLIGKIFGKKIEGKIGLSKTKLTAIIFVVVVAIKELSKAWGHPIEIPEYIIELLAGAGLWALRDGVDTAK